MQEGRADNTWLGGASAMNLERRSAPASALCVAGLPGPCANSRSTASKTSPKVVQSNELAANFESELQRQKHAYQMCALSKYVAVR